MTKTEIKTPLDLFAFFKEWGTTHLTALNGIVDKLPEGVRAEWQKMRDTLNDMLSKLKPIDQVPMAQDASYALNSFAATMANLMEYADSFRDRLNAMAVDIAGKATALNGFEQKVKDGELLTKASVDAALELARKEVKDQLTPSLTALRKNQISLAGLPEAPEATLTAAQADFDAAFGQASKNVKALTEKGFALNGKGSAWVKASAWMGETAFNGEMTKIADLVAPAAAAKPAGDPLLGGGAAAPAAEKKDAPKYTMA